MSNAVRNSRLEKGLKIDVYMFLIFFDSFQNFIFRNTCSHASSFLLQVGDTIDLRRPAGDSWRVFAVTSKNKKDRPKNYVECACCDATILSTHERVMFRDPIGVNDPFSFIRIGSECNTDWGGNQHAPSLPTANERVTANESY